MKTNNDIKFAFEQHDFHVEEVDDVLKVSLKEEVFIDTNLTQREGNGSITSRLDIKLTLANDQQIIECFADAGAKSEDAKNKNIQNFLLSSFHPIVACLNRNPKDPVITFEEWEIGQNTWEVYIGDFSIKGTKKNLDVIPDNLFETLEDLIKGMHIDTEYAWIRFYMGQVNNSLLIVELLVNNIPYTEGEDVLKKIEWDQMDGFYSIRNFIMMKKGTKRPWYKRLF